ncbi:hypothetical protein [Mycobacterium sp. OTB74]|jgi:hypothetical protein|uniref:hypothetical protein n=1 Tax=Mycobacterium sp. OTB74 TaxID=1853452 RepID=UPI002476DB79|nr:hypothetical protein [Mycobacterium sp. OTB74]MDH6247257.1 hypothetical protein [Mycobacterium sp. OTB74]
MTNEGAGDLPQIHVDFNPEHSGIQFDDNGTPILAYRSGCTTKARDQHGRPIPDGWVLHTADSDEYIVGNYDLTDVDRAVEAARLHLAR